MGRNPHTPITLSPQPEVKSSLSATQDNPIMIVIEIKTQSCVNTREAAHTKG